MQIVFQLLFFASIAAIAGFCFYSARIVWKGGINPLTRNFLLIAIFLEIVLAALHLIAESNQAPGFWDWFLDLQYEMNLGTIFSAVQLFTIAMVALVNGWLTPELKIWQRLYWTLLTITFVYLSLDEFYSFHETLLTRTPTEAWRIPYAIAGSILLAISGVAFWKGFRKDSQLFILMFTGLGIMMVSGIGVEEFVLRGFVQYDKSAEWMYVFEEIFEMVGATIILAVFLWYAQQHFSEKQWIFARRFLPGVAVVATAWCLLALFVIPALEARFLANASNIQFDNGRLSLVGYRLASKDVKPGGEIEITFYWRANEALPEDYSLSVHALNHADLSSMTQSDDLHAGPIPATAWFPGVVMRRTVYVPLPRSLPTPASYDVMLRLWYGPWPFLRPWTDTTGLVVSNPDTHSLLNPDMLLLDRVSAAPAHEIPPPQIAAAYDFPVEGFRLDGYDMPSGTFFGDTLSVEFWWETRKKTDRDLTQFLHLYPESDPDQPYTFDQKPFQGAFPTTDWPVNMRAVDKWEAKIPADLPAGTYNVYTGLYDLSNMQRSSVVDGDGQPQPDNRIFLGSITYEPGLVVETAPQDLTPYCYTVANYDIKNNTEDNTLLRMNKQTGEAELIGYTGTFEVEAITFAADASSLYAVEELGDVGQFGHFDLATGTFIAIGSGITPLDNLANSRAWGQSNLKDVDALSADLTTGRIWGITHDEENYLFEINPVTGEAIRNVFGVGNDFVKIMLTGLPEPGYIEIEDMAIDPRDGTFYIITTNDNYDSLIARLDFDTLNPEAGTIEAVPVTEMVWDETGETLRDAEGLSFFNDGTLYITTSNNSDSELSRDALWQVDLTGGIATQIDSFRNYFDFQDFESVACLTSGE